MFDVGPCHRLTESRGTPPRVRRKAREAGRDVRREGEQGDRGSGNEGPMGPPRIQMSLSRGAGEPSSTTGPPVIGTVARSALDDPEGE